MSLARAPSAPAASARARRAATMKTTRRQPSSSPLSRARAVVARASDDAPRCALTTSVIASTLEDALRDVRDAAEKGADIVELRVDFLGAAADVAIDTKYPPVVNPADGADAVARAAARLGVACSGDGLPLLAGEDFSYFLRPQDGGLARGAFFFVGAAEERYAGHASIDLETPGAFADAGAACRSNCTLHSTSFDFNDNALPVAAAMFVRLVEDRLGAELYPEDLR